MNLCYVAAGKEEQELANQKNSYHQAITVVVMLVVYRNVTEHH